MVVMDLRLEHNFMACGQAHGLDLGSEDDGQGVFGLGLQWIKIKNKKTQSHGGSEAYGLNLGCEEYRQTLLV